MNKETFYPDKVDFSSLNKIETKITEEIKKLDSKLIYQNQFSPASLFVGKVKKNQENYTIKIAFYTDTENNSWRIKHLQRERIILEQIQDINGIIKIEQIYESDQYLALLKKYIRGEHPPQKELDKKNYLLTKEQKNNLITLVNKLHKKKISGFDLDKKVNLLIPNENKRKIYLFDFGKTTSKELDGRKKFEDYKKEDLNDIKNFIIEYL